ncbi:hypothetical protein C6A85_09930, partial [Mycobacterium sp. ITM-2017-0098]
NGLAITALSDASFTLNRPEYLGAAIECADAVLDLHLVDGRLRPGEPDGTQHRPDPLEPFDVP